MKKAKKKFSIIVPVYNGQEVIENCIESILAMYYSNWELIIINDGSTDSTKEKCIKYLRDPRIILINKKNSGVSNSRNRGIDAATGDYIIFSDADDSVDKNICNIFSKAMEICQFCIAGYTKCFENEIEYIANTSFEISEGIYSRESFGNIFGELYKSGFINSPWSKCYKKSLIKEQFNIDYSLGEDFIFNMHYLMNCNSIYVTFQSVYFYNIQHCGTLSSGVINRGFETLCNVYEETKYLLVDTFDSYQEILRFIDEKYILDMMVMLERNIRYNDNFKNIQDIKKICILYELNNICQNVSLKNISRKWEIARFLISYKLYVSFYLYIKFGFYLNLKIKESSNARKIKNKNKR